MPDRRAHRGQHPDDGRIFGPDARGRLLAAAGDLAWLRSRGYGSGAALKLVGDRHALEARQRRAVSRGVCSDAEREARRSKEVDDNRLAGRPLWLDGYNVLTTVEAALAGGVLLACRDGTYRDMASMHGSYRKVSETLPALECIGRATATLGVSECHWFLDRPVSNSGRLKAMMEEVAARHGWPWRIELVADPDKILSQTDEIIATADSVILDRCRAWYSLARVTVTRYLPEQPTPLFLMALGEV